MGLVVLKNCSSAPKNNTPEVFKSIINNASPYVLTQQDLNGVNSIKEYSFLNSKVTSIDIPTSVGVTYNCFVGCSELSAITGYSASNNCIISSNQCLVGCKNSKLVASDVYLISQSAFSYKTSIIDITIPQGVQLDYGAFVGCSNLKHIQCSTGNGLGDSGALSQAEIASITSNVINSLSYGNLKNIEFLNGVSQINDLAFQYSTIDKLIITGNPSISQYAFSGSYGINYLELINGTLSDSSLYVSSAPIRNAKVSSVFQDIATSPSIKEFELVDGTTFSFPSSTLSIQKLTLPGTIRSIDTSFTSSLTYFNFKGTIDDWCAITFSREESNPIYYTHKLTLYGTPITKVVLPSNLTELKDYVFDLCYPLKSITMPNTLIRIGDFALCCCRGLTSLTIPNSVTSIGDNALEGCTGLTSITIPPNVVSIGKWAFLGCTGLASITIPSSVTSIGVGAFSNCDGAVSITIQTGLTYLSSDMFAHGHNLTSVTIPSSVTMIDDYAFYDCDNLVDIYYGGTMSDWGNITLVTCWDCGTGNYTIHCTDGDIPKTV